MLCWLGCYHKNKTANENGEGLKHKGALQNAEPGPTQTTPSDMQTNQMGEMKSILAELMELKQDARAAEDKQRCMWLGKLQLWFSEVSHPIQVGKSVELKSFKNTYDLPLQIDKREANSSNIINFIGNWKQVPSDRWILNCVKGLTIPFLSTPVQERELFPFRKDETEKRFVMEEIEILINKKVLKVVENVP